MSPGLARQMLVIQEARRCTMDTGKKEDDVMKDMFWFLTAVMTATAMFVWAVTALTARAAGVGRPVGGRSGQEERKENDEEPCH